MLRFIIGRVHRLTLLINYCPFNKLAPIGSTPPGDLIPKPCILYQFNRIFSKNLCNFPVGPKGGAGLRGSALLQGRQGEDRLHLGHHRGHRLPAPFAPVHQDQDLDNLESEFPGGVYRL